MFKEEVSRFISRSKVVSTSLIEQCVSVYALSNHKHIEMLSLPKLLQNHQWIGWLLQSRGSHFHSPRAHALHSSQFLGGSSSFSPRFSLLPSFGMDVCNRAVYTSSLKLWLLYPSKWCTFSFCPYFFFQLAWTKEQKLTIFLFCPLHLRYSWEGTASLVCSKAAHGTRDWRKPLICSFDGSVFCDVTLLV